MLGISLKVEALISRESSQEYILKLLNMPNQRGAEKEKSDWRQPLDYARKESNYIFKKCESHKWKMKYLTTKIRVGANLKFFSS